MKLDVFNDGEFVLPAKYEVCSRCRGRGVHDHPAITGFGPSDDWADEDFCEAYAEGVYNVSCEECHGERVVLVPDEEAMTPDQLREWHEYLRDRAESRAVERMERMMGA